MVTNFKHVSRILNERIDAIKSLYMIEIIHSLLCNYVPGLTPVLSMSSTCVFNVTK